MRQILVILVSFAASASSAFAQTPTPAKPADEKVFTKTFSSPEISPDKKEGFGDTLLFVTVPPPYQVCREIKVQFNEKNGSAEFERIRADEHIVQYGYGVSPDTYGHIKSKISGSASILGVLDRNKSNCPDLAKEFAYYLVETPDRVAIRRNVGVNLPPEKIFSKHISVSIPYGSGNLKVVEHYVDIDVDAPYHTCRVQSLDFKMTGNGHFRRSWVTDSQVSYAYQLDADRLFKEPSGIVADLAVVGVLDRDTAKCAPFADAFPLFTVEAPSAGWIVKERYISQNHAESNNGGWSLRDVTATAPDGRLYCTHKLQITNKNGANQFYPKEWSAKHFTIHYGVLSGGIFDHPASLGFTLYVRFVPYPTYDPSCTVPLAGHKPPGEAHQLPENVWYWTPKD